MSTQKSRDQIMAASGWVRPAALLRLVPVVGFATVYRRVKSGELKAQRPGGELYVDAAGLYESFLDSTTGGVTPISEAVMGALIELDVYVHSEDLA